MAVAIAVLLSLAAASAPPAAGAAAGLTARLAAAMRSAGRYSGAYVVDASAGRTVFSWRGGTRRILASNTKLFTSSAALARFGPAGTLRTEVRGVGFLDPSRVWHGDLYLVGGGDPTFGSRRFDRHNYGGGATVESLAAGVAAAGIRSVTGHIYGDESHFDRRRGGPASGYRTSIYVGPLSALDYDRGLASESGGAFQANPPLFAAGRLRSALARRGIRVVGRSRTGRAPAGSRPQASVASPSMARLVQLTNKPSDNFFAETLVKDLAMRATGRGTTRGGARIAAGFARGLGVRPQLVDGSGLSRGDRASPRGIVRLLTRMRVRPEFPALYSSLPIAGSDGTLSHRMGHGPARGRCRAKTGTLSNVSALSGFCLARSGHTYAFSILMNAVRPLPARALQDRMTQAIAGSG
jgi:serine-type D-Ala-D-Ala carboxypeptidase/endopeptidase (penicillin-binding protein 4)